MGDVEQGPLRGWRKNFLWAPICLFFAVPAVILISVGSTNLEKEENRWTEGKCVINSTAPYSCKESGQSIVFSSGVVFSDGDEDVECGSLTAEGWCSLNSKSSNCNGDDDDCDERADELYEESSVKCWIDGKVCWADDYKHASDNNWAFFIMGGVFIFVVGGCSACFIQSQLHNQMRQQAHHQQQQSHLVEIAPGGAAYPGPPLGTAAAPSGTLIQVQVPEGAKPGTTIRVQVPSGQLIDVQLPPGTLPGQQITVGI